MEERRKHQRFKLHDGCILNHSEIVGTIIDLSMGGLSCVCLNPELCDHGHPTSVDIYCRRHDLWAQDIRIKVLNSEILPGHFVKEFGIRKCRVQFENLAVDQMQQLEDIIVQTSLPEPPSMQAE